MQTLNILIILLSNFLNLLQGLRDRSVRISSISAALSTHCPACLHHLNLTH
jgi:hypothetical protein